VGFGDGAKGVKLSLIGIEEWGEGRGEEGGGEASRSGGVWGGGGGGGGGACGGGGYD